MYFWSVCFRGALVFLNCDDICMCVEYFGHCDDCVGVVVEFSRGQ